MLHFYDTMLTPLAKGTSLTVQEAQRLRSIRDLAPGDLIVVRDQHTFAPANTPTHCELIEGLEIEVSHKKQDKQVGF